jgi:hypothetical protein
MEPWMNKSPLAAFFLALIPGVGHGYLGRPVRAVLYAGAFFGPLALLFLIAISNSPVDDGLVYFLMFIIALAWGINMLDMILTLISGKVSLTQSAAAPPAYPGHGDGADRATPITRERQQEKSRIILLSLIPGLGHMSLGLMQRGITYLISCVGLFAIIVFLTMTLHTSSLLIFLLVLPVLWIHSLFDAISQLHTKHAGLPMVDRPLFEDLEAHLSSGHKNRVLAIALSIFPGAGHLYLGLQKRGLQLMGGFLLAIYIMDNLRLSLFFFLLPIYWCFAFFDALQQAARYERSELRDEPIMKQFVPYQKWFGFGLIVIGIYYILNRVAADFIRDYFNSVIFGAYMRVVYMLPTVMISFLLIVLGLRLVFGSKPSQSKRVDLPPPPRPEEGIR